jgi:hypothetical protein
VSVWSGPDVERVSGGSNEIRPVVAGPLVIGLFIDLIPNQAENPGFNVASRNEPCNLFILLNQVDLGLVELLIEPCQSLLQLEIVSIDNGDQLRLDVRVPSSIRGDFDGEPFSNPLLSAARRRQHEAHRMRFEPDPTKIPKDELLLPIVVDENNQLGRLGHLLPSSGDHFGRL